MCGIAGFVDFSGHDVDAARSRVVRMSDTLIHRGPDAGSCFVDRYAALGHRRLSIIDIAGGAQPMATEDGCLQLIYNGEIYNFLELRSQLEACGHRFRTRSDTEVILLGFRQWGEEIVERLNGMFALAIWDAEKRSLFLARDRVGKKPLYYASQGGRFFFASELKAVLAGGFSNRALDLEALDCYFTFGYVPAPLTIFKNARKLPAASRLSVNADRIMERRYWDLSFADTRDASLAGVTEEFEFLLDDAVACRLMSEVPLGAFLSGGLDSTLVVSSMARASQEPVLTNSIGFSDSGFNELPVARAVADHLGTEHRELNVESDVAGVIDRIAWHFDEPFADSSAIPTWHVCRMARENVTVALSGDGGDEGFAGYTFRYAPHLFESRLRASLPAWFRGPVFGALGATWPGSARLPRPLRLKTILENISVGDGEAFCRDLAWLRNDLRQRIYRPEFLESLRGFSPFECVLPLYAGSDANDPVGRSQAADIRFYMTDDILTKVDRMSMAHSLEVRCPLLDHRILEFAARLPRNLKMKGSKGKLPLRRLAGRRLPRTVLEQPKRGFAIPAAKWLRQGLRPMIEEIIADERSVVQEFLDVSEVRNAWNEHQSKARDHSVFLWSILMLHKWQIAHSSA